MGLVATLPPLVTLVVSGWARGLSRKDDVGGLAGRFCDSDTGSMAIPEIIPIAHEPWARTATIGRYEHGQFFASLTGAYPRSFDVRTLRDQWPDHNRFFAVLQLFHH